MISVTEFVTQIPLYIYINSAAKKNSFRNESVILHKRKTTYVNIKHSLKKKMLSNYMTVNNYASLLS